MKAPSRWGLGTERHLMPKITGSPGVSGASLYASNSIQSGSIALGQRIKGTNGTEFKYVRAGSAGALVVGNVLQSSAYTTNADALTPYSSAAVVCLGRNWRPVDQIIKLIVKAL